MLKNYLKEKNISYVEKFVDQDSQAQEEMAKISNGFMGVPFTVITKDDNSTETVVGFDRGKINSILKIA